MAHISSGYGAEALIKAGEIDGWINESDGIPAWSNCDPIPDDIPIQIWGDGFRASLMPGDSFTTPCGVTISRKESATVSTGQVQEITNFTIRPLPDMCDIKDFLIRAERMSNDWIIPKKIQANPVVAKRHLAIIKQPTARMGFRRGQRT